MNTPIRDLCAGVVGRERDYVISLGLPLVREGQSFKTQLRAERTASVHIYEGQGKFHDFGTGEQFDPIKLAMSAGGKSFREAVDHVRQFVGSTAPILSSTSTVNAYLPTNDPPPVGWQEPIRAAVERAHHYLMSGRKDAQHAREYLYGRGFTDATITKHMIGYQATTLDIWITLATGAREVVKMSAGIVIPWIANGALWSVNVRRMTAQADPKYLKVGYAGVQHGAALFGADDLRSGQDVLIVEGEIAAMIAAQHLNDVTVITFGSASSARLNPRWRAALAAAGRVVVCLDSDEAGEKGAAKLRETLPHVDTVASLPFGKDADGFIAAGGDLRQWFNQQVNPVKSAQPDEPGEVAHDHDQRAGSVFADGVPDGLRTVILHKSETAADIYDFVQRAAAIGLIDPTGWTIKDLEAAADSIGVKLPALARPIELLVNLGVFCKSRGNSTVLIVDDFAKTLPTKGGAPKSVYSLPSLSDQRVAVLSLAKQLAHMIAHPTEARFENAAAMATFTAIMVRTVLSAADEAAELAAEIEAISADLYADPEQEKARRRAAAIERKLIAFFTRIMNDGYSSPIDPEWQRSHGFRAAFTRALKAHRDDEVFNQGYTNIGLWIGVSAQTVSKVLKAAAVTSERGEVESVAITAHPDRAIPEIRRYAGERHAKPFAVVVTSGSGHTEQYPFTFDTARGAAARAQRETGTRFEVLYQLPNRQTLITDAQPEEVEAPAPRAAAADRTAEQVQRVAESEPRTIAAVEDTGYTPEWVIGQLKLRLVHRHGLLINPITGETAPVDAPVRTLFELVIGRKLRTPDPLKLAIAAVGGIARVSA